MNHLSKCPNCGVATAAVANTCSNCGQLKVASSNAFGQRVPSSGPQFAPPNGPPSRFSSQSMESRGGYSESANSYASNLQHNSAPSMGDFPQQRQQSLDERTMASRRQGSNGDNAARALATMFPLIGAGEDGKYTEGQVRQLLEIVEASQKYGKEIEQSVEELAELLRRKTLECDGLRALAQENYNPLRQAVRNEYESRVKQENRHVLEMRRMQNQLEALRSERMKLQSELESLRILVKELQSIPSPVSYDPSANTVLNQMLRTDVDVDNLQGLRPTLTAALRGSGVTSWSLPADPALLNPEQRDLVSYMASINAEHGKALQIAGVFDFIKVLCRKVCTPLRDGTHPDLGVAVGELLRDLRSGVNFAAIANQPIPAVQISWKQKVTQLFLANNPGQGQQLAMLLEDNKGHEEALYHRLRAEFEEMQRPPQFIDFDPANSTGSPLNQRIGYQAAVEAKAGAAQVQPIAKSTAVEDRELHARCIIMYKKYNPTKANSKEVAELLKKYPPEVLLAALVEKYGPEPTAAERRTLVRSLMEESGQ